MIYVECKPDSLLVREITNISKREIIHLGNKSEVCKRLRSRNNCVGLVDEDPTSGQPSYLKEMRLEENLSESDIKIRSDKNGNRLIVLCPRLEGWILKRVKEAGINIKDYSLPDSERELHEVINIDLRKFERLIIDLKNDKNIRALGTLLR